MKRVKQTMGQNFSKYVEELRNRGDKFWMLIRIGTIIWTGLINCSMRNMWN